MRKWGRSVKITLRRRPACHARTSLRSLNTGETENGGYVSIRLSNLKSEIGALQGLPEAGGRFIFCVETAECGEANKFEITPLTRRWTHQHDGDAPCAVHKKMSGQTRDVLMAALEDCP